jgi:predicted nucleic acid-binding protein
MGRGLNGNEKREVLMVFDSSTWIDFLNGKQSRNAALLQLQIREFYPVHICPPIFQEILQGIKNDERFEEVRDLVFGLNLLSLDPYFAVDGAISLYRKLRKEGSTVRKPNDCLIAFYAIHFKLMLVHNDKDFDKIAKHSALKIYST